MESADLQDGEQLFFSSPLSSGAVPQGEKARTARRRRRKARAAGDGAESKKRRLNDEQVKFLEVNFGSERKLESGRKMRLATELGLDPKQVAVWFQNRRARWKNKQLEEEYVKLKTQYDTAVLANCHLENEVVSLRSRLQEAEETIKRLSIGGGFGGGEEGRSPSSSSTETYQHPLTAATASEAPLGVFDYQLGYYDVMDYPYNIFDM